MELSNSQLYKTLIFLGRALVEGAQEAVQVLLRGQEPQGHNGSQQRDLHLLHHAGIGWRRHAQGGQPQLHLRLLRFSQF